MASLSPSSLAATSTWRSPSPRISPSSSPAWRMRWEFFGGVTRRVIIDNLKAAVAKSDRYAPVFNRTFLEYSEYRGFIIDPAPATVATGKPTVERQIPYVRKNFFQGETFRNLAHIQEEARKWCTETAGMRIHGTTRKTAADRLCRGRKRRCFFLSIKERFDTPVVGKLPHSTPTIMSVSAIASTRRRRPISARRWMRARTAVLSVSTTRATLSRPTPSSPPGNGRPTTTTTRRRRPPYALRSCTYHIEKAERSALPARPSWSSSFRRLPLGAAETGTEAAPPPARTYGKERVEKACRRALSFDLIDVRRVEEMITEGAYRSRRTPPEER